jgi:hypothetical protein
VSDFPRSPMGSPVQYAVHDAIAFGLGGQGVAQQVVEDGYQKSGEARQQIQQQQEQNQQEEQQNGSSESAEVYGDSSEARHSERSEARRLRREY